MKKSKLILLAITLIAIGISTSWILTSCNESNETENLKHHQAFDDLIKDLDDMTKEFMMSENITPGTRSNWFKRFFNAVGADVSAFWYDICHTVNPTGPTFYMDHVSSASSKAYHDLVLIKPDYCEYSPIQKEIFDSLQVSFSYIPESNNIGNAHNAVILEMIKNDSWEPENTIELVTSSVNTCKKLSIDVSDKPIQEIANSVDECILNYYTNPEFSIDNAPIQHDDEAKYLIEYYLYIIQSISTPHQVSRYTDSYIAIINDTCNQSLKLTDDQKQNVIDAIKVACASFDLWYHMTIIDGVE